MSKMNELSQILEEMIMVGEKLIDTANALKKYYSTPAEEKASLPESTEAKPNETTTAPTKTDVRAVLAAKSAAGYKADVQALLLKYGATQLKAINPSDYAALIQEAEVIGNA